MINYFGLNIKNIREHWGLSQKDLGIIIGASRGMIMQYEGRGSIPNSEMTTRIEEITGIPASTLKNKELNRTQLPEKPEKIDSILLTYKDHFAQKEARSKDLYMSYLATKSSDELWQGVPIYDTVVAAGMSTLIRDEKMPEPAYYLPIPGFKDCSFGARVSGDSMYPEIRNGDFVICKEVQDFIFGDIYLVITRDGQETVKYVHPNESPDMVNLVPYNKSIPITPIAKSNIVKVYKVKGVLKGY